MEEAAKLAKDIEGADLETAATAILKYGDIRAAEATAARLDEERRVHARTFSSYEAALKTAEAALVATRAENKKLKRELANAGFEEYEPRGLEGGEETA